ncbi:MAG TPA: glycosyltransferase [Aquificae bacterium]|nr:glycosyltransferase [Aquificota bacterium]
MLNMINLLFIYLVSFLISFLINLWIVKTRPSFAVDEIKGIQKFHSEFIPRVGGLGIFIAFATSLLYLYIKTSNKFYLYLILASLPVFLGGLLEDITKKVSPGKRLFLAFISGFLCIFLLGVYISRSDIPLIDKIFTFTPFAILFTTFVIAGLSNAFNIIDGFNGLSSAVAMIVLISFAYIGLMKGDFFLLNISLVTIFSILGFFVLNYPFGKIFLGDGGSYLIGFVIGFLSTYIIFKYKDISPWYPLALSIYPVFETLFSIYRRMILRKYNPFKPDNLHLHTLLYRKIIRKLKLKNNYLKNSLVMPVLISLYLPFVVIANFFWDVTDVLALLCGIYIVLYLYLYSYLSTSLSIQKEEVSISKRKC